MKNGKYIKFVLIIPALAGLILLANIPDFSTKANAETSKYENEDEITIDKIVHDFGTVKETDSVKCTFTLTNKSKTPVVITQVSPSCGCTTPEWTREPISPRKTGKITAIFNPKNRLGPFDKSITILTSGNPDRIVVRIKGTVVE